MVLSFRYFAFSLCVLLAFQQVVIGLTCYQCNACGNQNSWGTTSSSSNGAGCYKYAYDYGSVSYANRDVRSPCMPGSDGTGGTVYCCSTDYCNSSVSLSNSLGLAFTLIIVVSFFKGFIDN